MEGIVDLVSSLRQGEADYSLPAWAELYRLKGEAEAVARLAKAGESVERARKKQDAARHALAELEERKVLFTGTGPALETQARRAFERLGCEVEEGDTGRADLLIRSGDRVAVVEVKGLTKSAKESDAAQLEKWVSIHLEREGIQPKGILVVNAFVETELRDRTEASFPDQMLDYCLSRGHCLLTGGQLLKASTQASNDPVVATALVDSIFDCVGIYDRYQDWAETLTPDLDTNLGLDDSV